MSRLAALGTPMPAGDNVLPIGGRRRSIQFWLAWLVVACVLPAALADAVLIMHSYSRERATLEKSTIATTRALAQVVERDLVGVTAGLQVLALSHHLATDDFADFHAAARQVLLTQPGNGIVVIDTTGQQIMSTLTPYGKPLPHARVSDLLRGVFESAKPAISNYYIGATSGKPQVAVGVPVLRDGKVIYGLVMGILPEHLADILHNQHLPSDWTVSVFDRMGTIVARTRAPDQFVGTKGSTAFLLRIAESPEGIVESDTLEGVPVLASFSRSAISGWTVVIGVSTAALTAGLRQSLLLNASAAVLLLLTGIVLARSISGRISRSIRALTASTLALGSRGTLSISRAEITEVDALGQVLVDAYRLIEQRGFERDEAERGKREMLAAKRSAEATAEAAVREIAQRRKAEQTFKDLLEAAPDAMVIVGRTGDIVIINSQTEKLFGYVRAELLGRKIELLMPSRFHARHLPHRDQFFVAPNARAMGAGLELFGRRKDGTEFPIEISLSPLETEDGTLVLSSIRDITERKHDEGLLRDKNVELQAAVDELDAFCYSVSHDLRGPLRAIDGFSQILLKQYGPTLTEEPLEYLQLVRDNTVQMGHLVDDLLRFSRLGRQPLSKEQVPTGTMVEQILRDMRQQAVGRCVKVSVGEMPALWGDPALIKQVFVNLIDNAYKYTRMRAEAVIEIGASMIGGEQVVFVRDNGAGFDMQYADKLFGVFRRMHRAEDFEGTGVGLAIVQRIVQRHGGRIWAEAAVDRGAAFYFTTEPTNHG